MDYFAYDFETDDSGTRFREAYNARTVGGIRFQDYLNFTSPVIAAPEIHRTNGQPAGHPGTGYGIRHRNNGIVVEEIHE